MRNIQEFANFAPDEGGGAAGGGAAAPSAPAAPAAPASSPAPSAPSSPASAGGTPAPAVVSPGGAAPVSAVPHHGTPAAPASPTWLTGLKDAGLPVGADEPSTITALKQMYQERQAFESIRHLIPHVQSYLAKAKEFNEWQSAQSKTAPAAPAAAPNANDPWWKETWQPPEYDRAWQHQVTRDDKGNVLPNPGTPAEIAAKYVAAQQFRNNFADKFLDNPWEALGPLEKRMEQRAQEIAEKIFNERTQRTQVEQNATGFVEYHKSWLFEMDPTTGQPKTANVINPATGQWQPTQVLSPWGERMSRYAKELSDRGFGFGDVQSIAYDRVQRDYSTYLLQQAASGQITSAQLSELLNGKAGAPAAPAAPAIHPQDAANAAFLNQANPAGAAAANGRVPPAEETVTGKNLAAVLRRELKRAGYTKETMAN